MGDTGDTNGSGVSHGVSLGAYGLRGFGDDGHGGVGANLSYVLGVPLLSGENRLFLDPSLGFDIGHFSHSYTTPGGEAIDSSFTRYGGRLGLALRYVPPFLDHRLWASFGMGVGLFGFGTPQGNTVATPASCVPLKPGNPSDGNFGRGECDPKAGPQKGNGGTAGLYNPHLGASRETSGIGIIFDFPLTIGADVLRGDWGSGGLYLNASLLHTGLSPSDGNGLGYWGFSGGFGFIARFGGSAVEKPNTPPPPSVTVDQMSEVTSPTIVGNDAVDPVFDMTLASGRVTGTLSGTMTGPNGQPATFEFVDKEVKSYPATIRVKITQKPLNPGVYTLNYTITSADKKQQAKGVAKFTVSAEPTLKLDKFSLTPAEFYAGHKNVKLRMETSLKDGDKVKKITLTFKKRKDDKDEIGTDVGVKPMTFESLAVGSKGMVEMEKLDLSALDGNASYIVVASVEGQDGQVKQISTGINVKPKAELAVKGLGESYVPGTIAPISLKLTGVEKIKVRVTVTTTTSVKPAWNKPAEDVTVVDSQIIEVTNAKEEKFSLRCQTTDKKTVMIAEGGKGAKTGNYTVTFEAVNDKGEVIQPLAEPRSFSVAPATPTFTGGKFKKSGS
jgi:methionine-rich copper-binding protein CopC